MDQYANGFSQILYHPGFYCPKRPFKTVRMLVMLAFLGVIAAETAPHISSTFSYLNKRAINRFQALPRPRDKHRIHSSHNSRILRAYRFRVPQHHEPAATLNMRILQRRFQRRRIRMHITHDRVLHVWTDCFVSLPTVSGISVCSFFLF